MPEELLATIPPIMQESMEDGVGANLVLDVVLALGLVPGQQRVDLTTNQSWLNSDAATIALQIRKLFWSGHVCTTCSWKGLEVQSRLRETLFCRCAR